MSQPNSFENYGYLLDTVDLWNFEGEALRIEEPEDLQTNPNVEGMESDPAGDNEDDNDDRHLEEKSSRRTRDQTQKLMAFFERGPKPTRKQREEIGRVLGMTQLQVKFWFQNRRSALTRQHKSKEFMRLKTENAKLRIENVKYKKALEVACLKCGSQMSLNERQLVVENTRLKEEIGKIFAIASKHVRDPSISTNPYFPSSSHPPHRFQGQSSSLGPTPVPSEEMATYHSGWNYPINEPAVMADQSNPEAPNCGPRDACNLTLTITDPQEGTSRSLESPRRRLNRPWMHL